MTQFAHRVTLTCFSQPEECFGLKTKQQSAFVDLWIQGKLSTLYKEQSIKQGLAGEQLIHYKTCDNETTLAHSKDHV